MTSDANLGGGLSLPVGKEEPRRHYVGEVIGAQPAVKRVSRRVALRGYRVFVATEIDESGKVTKTAEMFKPTLQLDRGLVNPSKYVPHQSERECVRRIRQACRQGMTPTLDLVV
jgi:dienelactone hydrolase